MSNAFKPQVPTENPAKHFHQVNIKDVVFAGQALAFWSKDAPMTSPEDLPRLDIEKSDILISQLDALKTLLLAHRASLLDRDIITVSVKTKGTKRLHIAFKPTEGDTVEVVSSYVDNEIYTPDGNLLFEHYSPTLKDGKITALTREGKTFHLSAPLTIPE